MIQGGQLIVSLSGSRPTSAFPPTLPRPFCFLPRSNEYGQPPPYPAARLPIVNSHRVDNLDAPSPQLIFDGRNVCSGITRTLGKLMGVVISVDGQDDDFCSIGDGAGNACKRRPGGLSPNSSIRYMDLRASRSIPSSTAGHISFSGTAPRTVLEPRATICADAKLVGARMTLMTISKKTRIFEQFISVHPLVQIRLKRGSVYQMEHLIF
jgi:hypothetical protein